MYSVKEIFYSLQGEGAQTGRASVFCRFAGCNLWSGREQDRSAAVCDFCDTDFVGVDGQNGGKFSSAEALAERISQFWPDRQQHPRSRPYVVFTGGEPALQLDAELIAAMHQRGWEVAIETNGTHSLPAGIDWICVSPKGAAPLKVVQGNELKLVYPQPELQASPHYLEALQFDHFFIQPMADPSGRDHLRSAVQFCLENPQWRLSLQTHKILDID